MVLAGFKFDWKRLENFAKNLEKWKTRSKPPERNSRISEQGANRSKKTRECDNKEQPARKEPESFKTGSKPLERDWRISKETREIENKGQTVRKELENFKKKEGAHRSKETRESENKEQTARKELENFRSRSKLLERD